MSPNDTPEGRLMVYVDLSVTPQEMAQWPPRCITAFFEGISQAQGAIALARQAIRDRQAIHASAPRAGAANE